jgi:asparagine synthase (glutamine-hydrolysing)
MCGIAGILNYGGAPVAPSVLQAMTDAIVHRGPDGQGHWIEDCVGLGHRRLAVIDLSSLAHQPMMSHENRYVMTYNGEIYNFRELRTQLQAMGYPFRSESDSEVLLTAWAAWGVRALERLNGMFAFAIWDRTDKTLTLARDRYGIKPLYIAETARGLSFGSEQKAILARPGQSVTVDREALLEYFTFQNLFTNRTLTQGITLLPAGHYAVLDTREDNPRLKSTQYWDFNFTNPTGKTDRREYIEELDRLFTKAVNRQLVTDVELGSYLSGGMDSGSITAVATQSIPDLKTFTCGFDLSSASGIELGFDERVAAEAMSARFRTEHYEMVLKAGDMERCLPRLAFHLEEPRVGQSYPNFYAAQLASKFVKVVMSGTGGDELFGGYPWRYYRAAVCADFNDYVDQYYGFWQRLADNNELHRMFAPIQGDIQNVWTRDIFCDVLKKHKSVPETPEDYINQSLYFEAKTFLHSLFVVEDKLSMAHSLETRVPFMDNDLVEFAMRCPVELKLNNLAEVVRLDENEPGNKYNKYFRKTNDGKQILRDMMTKYMPDNITQAAKQGFSSPDASWFKGESIDFVRKRLLDKNAPVYDFLDFDVTSELVQEHLDGRRNRRLLIWSLLNFNEWTGQVL